MSFCYYFSKFFFPVVDDLLARSLSSSIKKKCWAIHLQNLKLNRWTIATGNGIFLNRFEQFFFLLFSVPKREEKFWKTERHIPLSLHRNLNLIVCRQKYCRRHGVLFFPISTRIFDFGDKKLSTLLYFFSFSRIS